MVSDESRARPALSTGSMPLRIGTSAEFARVRNFLRDARFDESTVKKALDIPTISRLRDADCAQINRSAVPPVLLTLIDIFIGGDAVAPDRLRVLCGDTTFAALAALDLIRDVHDQPGEIICPIWLYPVNGFVIASDRQTNPKGSAGLLTNEVVFPAHDSGTLQLLRLLPRPRGTSIELCSGSGIGALHLARNGTGSVGVDITSRSAHYAAFNARLNGLKVESLCGDLYSPIAGRKFDLICAHPPWLPSTGDGMIFRDGGDTGEAILQRIIAGLPDHLAPGGTAILVSLGRDGRDASFQHRVRGWLGEAGGNCDIIVGVDQILSIEALIGSMLQLHLKDKPEKADRLASRLRELGAEKFLHGATFIRQTEAPVAEPPLRLQMSDETTALDFERIFVWRGFRRTVGFADRLAAATPRLPADLELNIRHIARDGSMTAHSATLTVRHGLFSAVQPDVWAAQMLTHFDGYQTVANVFETARQACQTPVGFTLEAFIEFVGHMAERGVLTIDPQVVQGTTE
jgi:SAM-dependent methyltransferase